MLRLGIADEVGASPLTRNSRSLKGTKDRKRWARAVTPPLDSSGGVGCLTLLLGSAAILGWVYSWTGRAIWLLLGLPLALGIVYEGYGIMLLAVAHRLWTRAGVRCLVIHSDSPVWREHIRTRWLPRIGHAAAMLNWSERASWRPSLAVRLFDRFCGRSSNFNPAVIVFRGLRRPLVFRFFNAFREAKQGRAEYLDSLENDLFAALDGRTPLTSERTHRRGEGS